MKRFGRLVTGLSFVVLSTGIAVANDSQAEFGLGGITLVRSDAIRMMSEDLRISEKRIEVDYVFLNTAPQDVDTLVAFPLPDFENTEKFAEIMIPDYRGELDFRTSIEGRPAPLTLVQTATHRGVDVTAQLTALGLPIMPLYEPFTAAMRKLPKEKVAELVRAGLVEDMGDDGSGNHDYLGLWRVKTSVTRRQVFPAGRPVRVSHSYKPFVGGSVGGRFSKDMPRDAEFDAMRAKYCIDDDFLRAMNRKTGNGRSSAYSEKWISYVLVSGANWKGPIGRFRMEIDKGAAQNLVSFCGDGVKKLDDRRFEVVYKDFVPKKDVDVLIVDFALR